MYIAWIWVSANCHKCKCSGLTMPLHTNGVFAKTKVKELDKPTLNTFGMNWNANQACSLNVCMTGKVMVYVPKTSRLAFQRVKVIISHKGCYAMLIYAMLRCPHTFIHIVTRKTFT